MSTQAPLSTPPATGAPPTADELNWLEYYRSSKSEGFKNANDSAKICQATGVAFTTAYLSVFGALKVADKLPSSTSYIVLALTAIIFQFATMLAIIATIPIVGKVDPDSPTDIANFHFNSLLLKIRLITVSVMLLLFGVLVSIGIIDGLRQLEAVLMCIDSVTVLALGVIWWILLGRSFRR